MRLPLPSKECAEPTGFVRWILLGALKRFNSATGFFLHQSGSSGRESAPFNSGGKSEPTHVGCYGSGVQRANVSENFPSQRQGRRVVAGNSLDVGCSMLDVPCSSKVSAFTLIELVIVIVIIGIAAAMIVPEMKGGYQDALLRSTSRELINVFSIASSRAVSLNQLHRVRIETGSGRYVIEKRTRETVQGDEYKPLNDVSEAQGTLDKRIAIQLHNLDDTQSGGAVAQSSQSQPNSDTICFYSDGTADAAELLLRDRQGYRMVVRINPITAHVKIQELARE